MPVFLIDLMDLTAPLYSVPAFGFLFVPSCGAQWLRAYP